MPEQIGNLQGECGSIMMRRPAHSFLIALGHAVGQWAGARGTIMVLRVQLAPTFIHATSAVERPIDPIKPRRPSLVRAAHRHIINWILADADSSKYAGYEPVDERLRVSKRHHEGGQQIESEPPLDRDHVGYR